MSTGSPAQDALRIGFKPINLLSIKRDLGPFHETPFTEYGDTILPDDVIASIKVARSVPMDQIYILHHSHTFIKAIGYIGQKAWEIA